MTDMKSLGERLAAGKAKNQGWIDDSVIRELADMLNDTGLTEIEIEQGGARVRVARQGVAATVLAQAAVPVASPAPTAPVQPAAAPAASGPVAGSVPSPMVGTAYTAPEPGKPPFVKVGDAVKEGDTILIVEAMKTMNPIAAPHSGTVKEICVHDGEPVEFGQTLLVIA